MDNDPMNTGAMAPPGLVNVQCSAMYGLGYAPMPGVAACTVSPEEYEERVDYGPEEPASKTHDCTGTARVLKGNAATIGSPGGFSGPSVGDIMITASGAAIIPEQWGGSKAALRPYLNQISGVFPDVGASFNGVVDVVGGQTPLSCPANQNVRTCLMNPYPGQLMIELPGATKDYDSTTVVLTLPTEVDCPQNTHEIPHG